MQIFEPEHVYNVMICVTGKTRTLIGHYFPEVYAKLTLLFSFDDESFICTNMELRDKSVIWCSLWELGSINGWNIQWLAQLFNYVNVAQKKGHYSNVMDSCSLIALMGFIRTYSPFLLATKRVSNSISMTKRSARTFLCQLPDVFAQSTFCLEYSIEYGAREFSTK